ncbi:Crp/Fnr family transcriptional regulator [Sphingobacterium detergens]|uniref:CRP-like cAMP-binding protein n=1 Tax=Sphingobacterium detergens TaxID=1145106 RepID=A0A420AQV8_SPHD1|nr:Crp/Fnr family transcriptional regulator [Sphingobacterium detergens]RKE46849.1 CRP-like cAMP-binding protein [Sphingobacterium detergens]
MDKEPTEKLISTIMQHVSLLPEMQEQLLSHIFIKKIFKDQYLSLHEKDHFYVHSGILKKLDPDTGDIAHFIVEGDFGIFPSEKDTYSFVGLEPCTIVVIRVNDIDSLLSRYRQLITPYRHMIFDWAQQRQRRISLMLLPAGERKAAMLERLGPNYNRIQNKDLASYLKISEGYFSKLQL